MVTIRLAFIIPCAFFLDASFLHTFRLLSRVHHVTCRPSFNISGLAGLVVINSFSFCLCRIVLIPPSLFFNF